MASGSALASTAVATPKDTVESQKVHRWSIFSRGGPAAAVPTLQAPNYARACDAFWDALNSDDVNGVRQVLNSVGVLQREQLFMTPSAEALEHDWAPKLPLCRAVASGSLPMTETLLAFHADPWMGDPWVGGGAHEIRQPAATPAYWGVIYGERETLRAVYKFTRSTLEARRALCQAVHANVLTWLVSKGVTANQLAPAMVAAVGRNDAAGVRLLAKAGVDVNLLCPTEAPASSSSLLAYALAADRFDAAAVLLEFGAHAADSKLDPAAKGNASEDNFPLTMAIRKGQVGLVRQMLQAIRKEIELPQVISKAQPPVSDTAYLIAAFDAPNTVETYMAIYRAGLKPKTITDAERILSQAKDKNLDFLYAFVVRQRSLLLLDNEKHGNEAAKRAAKEALDTLADALSENPNYAASTALLNHAQAMDLDQVMPSRSVFNIFGRWGAKKGKQASHALADAAANVPVVPGPYLLGM